MAPAWSSTVTTVCGVRWEQLFADLEAQLASIEDAELRSEVADRTRREQSSIALLSRLSAAVGSAVRIDTAAGEVSGSLVDTAPAWVLVAGPVGAQVLVPMARVLAVRGVPRVAAPAPVQAAARIRERLGLAHALRAVARDRSPVTVALDGGLVVSGTVQRVGADWLDLTEHPVGEPPRRAGVTGLRTVAFSALVLVRSC